jgi:hypothetical protein
MLHVVYGLLQGKCAGKPACEYYVVQETQEIFVDFY